MDPSKNGRGHVFSEVFLMPNTHTGPGAGRWEATGGRRAPQARPQHHSAAHQPPVKTASMLPQPQGGSRSVAHGAPGPRESASTAQRCPGRPWGSSACSRRADSKKLKQLWEADGEHYRPSWLLILSGGGERTIAAHRNRLARAVPKSRRPPSAPACDAEPGVAWASAALKRPTQLACLLACLLACRCLTDHNGRI